MPFHIFKHPLVKEFYFQNKEFYDEVRDENYDIFEFARKMAEFKRFEISFVWCWRERLDQNVCLTRGVPTMES